MDWKKVNKLKYINGRDVILFDKMDGIWDAVFYVRNTDIDGQIICSSRNFKELEQDAKKWMKKH